MERHERAVPRERAALLQELAKLGATPALTIANPPYTGGDAADWWRQAAKAAILIRQVYFTSPNPKGLYKLGPERASRSMRKGMRGLSRASPQIGIPAGRVALELQFQSAPGQGGRQGLQPRSAWLEFVKLEALAAKQVAAETKIQGVWSWGWPSFSRRRQRPRQACGGVRLALDARPEALRRPEARGRLVRHVAHRGADLAAGRRALHARPAHDPEGRRRSHGGADRRPRLGRQRAAAARGAACAGARRPGDGARGRARDRPRPLRRQRLAVSLPRSPRCISPLADARAIVADRLARDLVKDALPAAAAVEQRRSPSS